MVGYLYILSSKLELNDLTGDVEEKVGFYIQYQGGQFIKSHIRIKPNPDNFYEEVFKTIQEYFKGDLKLMI